MPERDALDWDANRSSNFLINHRLQTMVSNPLLLKSRRMCPPYRGRTGAKGTPQHAVSPTWCKHGIVEAGKAKRKEARQRRTWKTTESPYYSRLACKRFSSQTRLESPRNKRW